MRSLVSWIQELSPATRLVGGVVVVAGVAVVLILTQPTPAGFPAFSGGAPPSTATASPDPVTAAADRPSRADSPTPSPSPPASASASPRPAPSVRATTTPASAAPSQTTAGVAECQAADMQVTLQADRSSYAQGQVVTLTMRARNAGTATCEDRSNACMDSVTVDDSSGNEVWQSTHPGAGTCPVPTTTQLAPGQSVTDTYRWDQTRCTDAGCPGPAVPPGTYNAVGAWQFSGGQSSSSNTVRIVVT